MLGLYGFRIRGPLLGDHRIYFGCQEFLGILFETGVAADGVLDSKCSTAAPGGLPGL